MNHYKLNQSLYVTPTPAGAYYCVSCKDDTAERQLIHHLLSYKSTPLLTLNNLKQWLSTLTEQEALDTLFHSQETGLITGTDAPIYAPTDTLEKILPDLLAGLSDNSMSLLADTQGFYLCSHGTTHEIAEEVSALSADIATMHERHQHLIQKSLILDTSAWSLVDSTGNSQMGFWPMYIGEHRFVLVISGFPYLNQPQLTKLIWALYHRYGN